MGASVTAVGPVGYDDVATPSGSFRGLLGGSAVFFALAAAVFAPTRIVAAVGDDLPDSDLALLARQGVDVSGVVRLPGRSHRWSARYAGDLSRAETLLNDLGVMEGWRPALPPQRRGDVLYVGSLEPQVQLALLRSRADGVFTAFDTQAHWIAADRATALEACARCDLASLSESELLELTGAGDVDAAAAILRDRGTFAVAVKRGARGATLFHEQGTTRCAAVAFGRVEDPTGAGDSFAGGMLGRLATLPARDPSALADALAYGVATASLAVERPAGVRTRTWSIGDVEARRRQLAAAVAS